MIKAGIEVEATAEGLVRMSVARDGGGAISVVLMSPATTMSLCEALCTTCEAIRSLALKPCAGTA